MKRLIAVVLPLCLSSALAAPSMPVFAPESQTGSAIQKAIDAASAAGGGVVRLEPAIYPSGTLYLKSNVELHFEEGAVLLGYDRPERYDDVDDPRIRKAPEKSKKVFIACLFQDNVAITGNGVIDGQGPKFYDTDPKVRKWGMYPKPAHPRPRMLEFVGCRNVRFEDVTFKDSPGWTCWARMCENFVAERVKIHADQLMINNDGFHIDGCRHVRIRNCDLKTGDDCVVMRAIRTADGESALCEDMVVEDCSLDSLCQGVRLGCPSDGTIRHGVFRRLKIAGVHGITSFHPVHYLQEGSRGGFAMEDILFEDCEITAQRHAFNFGVEPGVTLKAFGNVTFRNIVARGGEEPLFKGTGNTKLQNLRFENVTYESVPGEAEPPAVNTSDCWERIP